MRQLLFFSVIFVPGKNITVWEDRSGPDSFQHLPYEMGPPGLFVESK